MSDSDNSESSKNNAKKAKKLVDKSEKKTAKKAVAKLASAKSNPALKPEKIEKSNFGFKTFTVKTVGPYQTASVNKDPYWHFVIRSNKNEWIRVNVNSLSAVVFGTYKVAAGNPADGFFQANNADPEVATEVRSLRAKQAAPDMFLDPSVMGAGFVWKVDVTINNVPVPTNGALATLFSQYARCCHVYNADSKKIYLALASDIDMTKGRNALNKVTDKATNVFDYLTFNSQEGTQIQIPLRGIFPFDCSNKTIESIERRKEEGYFLPPDTTLEIKIHKTKSIIDSIFHPGVSLTGNYWTETPADDISAAEIKLTFQEVTLQYESGEMRPVDHLATLSQFKNGNLAVYKYDIARGQHQALVHSQSFTENNFQIWPQCRLIYILFCPDWATFIMETQRKPLSGLSRFPAESTEIECGYAGVDGIVTKKFKHFGTNAHNDDVTKKIYYEYLISSRMFSGPFGHLFPRGAGAISLVQAFVFDMKNHLSDKTEHLKVSCLFAGTNSPKNTQMLVLSVHQNGKATCKSGPGELQWQWEFLQTS